MSSVSQAGRTIISDADGGWEYTPGSKGADGVPVYPVRSKVGYWKPLTGTAGEHSLTVDFAGDSSEVSGFVTTIKGLYDDVVGTLSVPHWPSVPRTVFTGKPEFSPIKALANDEFLITVQLRLLEL